MAEAEPKSIQIPGGKKRRGGIDPYHSKSVPVSFYKRRDPPPAPRHRPLRSKEDPESLQLPPPSPLDDHKIHEVIRLGRSLTKTRPEQLLYPSSLPSANFLNKRRLKDLSLTPKKPDLFDDTEASPSSSVHSAKEDTEHDEFNIVGSQPIVGSLSSTVFDILAEGNGLSRNKASILNEPLDLDEEPEDDDNFERGEGIFELEDD